MKAKIRDIDFSPDVLTVGVDMYFEADEDGYADWWLDIPDYPATELEPNPPTHKEYFPFRRISINLPTDTTKQQAITTIRAKLEAFNRAYVKVAAAQRWVGQELTL